MDVWFSWREKSRRYKVAVVLGGLVLLYAILGVWVLPAIARAQLRKRLPAAIPCKVEVGAIRINPFALTVSLENFALSLPNGDPVASWGEFHVNAELWSSVFKRAWTLKEVRLDQPRVTAILNADGSLNFTQLTPTNAPSTPPPAETNAPGPLPRVVVKKLHVSQGVAAFVDRTLAPEFRTRTHTMDFTLDEFNTLPEARNPHRFTAGTESGGTITWSGRVTLEPITAEGRIEIANWKMRRYSPLLRQFPRVEIANGRLGLALDYHVAMDGKGVAAVITNAALSLRNVEMRTRDAGETFFALPQFAVTNVVLDTTRHLVHVGAITASNCTSLARLEKDGTVSVANCFQPVDTKPSATTNASEAAATTTTNAPGPPWTIRLDALAFDDFTIQAEDHTLPTPAKITLDQLAVRVNDFAMPANAAFAASLAFRFNHSGTMRTEGTITLEPLSADLQIAAEGWDLTGGNPYLVEKAKLKLAGGLFGMRSHFAFAKPSGGDPQMKFDGDLTLTNFGVVDVGSGEDLVKFDSLALKGIDADLRTMVVKLAEINLQKPVVRCVLSPEGKPNVPSFEETSPAATNATAKTETPPPSAESSAATNTAPWITVGALVVGDGSLQFIDESIEPKVAMSIDELRVRIEDISSRLDTRLGIDVGAKVSGRGPIAITGNLRPLKADPLGEVRVDFKNVDLTPLSPYLGKYVGYPLRRGKLELDLVYRLADRKLNADNKVLLDQFTLGASTGSPDAVKLPVKLALALLKDRRGQINIDVPVAGKTDDPEFRLGRVIVNTVVNIIVKAAAAPFNLLGSLVGGGGEELGYVRFEPGSSVLLETEKAKLDTLARALYERPALTLEIAGSADAASDRDAIRRTKLQRELKRRVAGAKAGAEAIDAVMLEPKAYERFVEREFIQRFGESAMYRPREDTARKADANKLPAAPHWSSRRDGAKQEDPSRARLSLAELEAKVFEAIPVHEEEYRALMEARTKAVFNHLSQDGKVEAERLVILPAKPPFPPSGGASQVDLSLN